MGRGADGGGTIGAGGADGGGTIGLRSVQWGEEQMGEEQLGRVERGPQSNWGKRESTSRRIEDERWTNVGQVLDNIQTQYTLLRHEDT